MTSRPPFRPDNAPSPAVQAGYRRQTFYSKMAASRIDTHLTKADGFEWYPWSFFGNQVPGPEQFVAGRTLGRLDLTGGAGTANGQLATAAKTATGQWVGHTFAGGGYFEVEMAFDPSTLTPGGGYPAFWSMAIEHLAVGDEHWPGQVLGYDHFIELDFFEYMVAADKGANWYGVNLHDKYGVWPNWTNIALPYSEVTRQAPVDTNWTDYHRIGCLWVPATWQSQGMASFFFDGNQVGNAVTWGYFDPNSQPPPGTARFGILDHQRLALILGTGAGQELSVRSVKVWQR